MANIDRVITATVDSTGEVLEYHLKTPSDLTKAFIDVQAHIKAYSGLKNSMLNLSMDILSRQQTKGDSDADRK